MIKRILTLLIAAVLCTTLLQPIFADDIVSTVTSFTYDRAFNFPRQVYLKGELAELYEIVGMIEDCLGCTITRNDGTTYYDVCTVIWNIDDIPLEIAGNYDVVATLIPPDGCNFGSGVRQRIVLPIQILDTDTPTQIVKLGQWNPYSVAIAIEQWDSIETVKRNTFFRGFSLECFDENETVYKATINWDFSQIDTQTVGLYYAKGTLVPPEGCEFAKGLELPEIVGTVSVQAPGKPDINCYRNFGVHVIFPYVKPPGDLNKISVWLKEDGKWRSIQTDDGVGVYDYALFIEVFFFQDGKTYELQVDYDGGRTGILTFTSDKYLIIKIIRVETVMAAMAMAFLLLISHSHRRNLHQRRHLCQLQRPNQLYHQGLRQGLLIHQNLNQPKNQRLRQDQRQTLRLFLYQN